MDDPASHQHSAPRDPLAPLYGKLPRGWEAWTGIGGLLYARKSRTSPPVVFRAPTAEELAGKIREYEDARS